MSVRTGSILALLENDNFMAKIIYAGKQQLPKEIRNLYPFIMTGTVRALVYSFIVQ
jgi:hypothetical protein